MSYKPKVIGEENDWIEVTIVEADFEQGTTTFTIPDDFEVFAGKYELRRKSDE